MILVVLIYRFVCYFRNYQFVTTDFRNFWQKYKKTVIGVTKIAFFCAGNVLYDIFCSFFFRIFAP